MPPTSKSTNTESRKLKILMLHGYTQSGPLFAAKTQRIKKLLEKSLASLPIKTDDIPITGVDLFYPTGPFKVSSADLNGAEKVWKQDLIKKVWKQDLIKWQKC
ncbi:hypothetical protein KCU73_g18367, partial [Aureobasidium melanogenum]